QSPLSRRAPLASLDEPLGQIEVGLSEVKVLPPFVDTTADVLPVASTVPFPSAPLMSGGEPENERLLLKLVFLENATVAAVRPAPEKALDPGAGARLTTTGLPDGLRVPRLGPSGTLLPVVSLRCSWTGTRKGVAFPLR